MAVKHLKPTSAGRRWQTISDFSEITCTKPEKSLLEPLPKKAGRNNNGRITTRHQGGGVKRRYRVIDFKRNKDGVPAKVATIEYDPNRSARIALLHYADGEKRYILAPKGLKVGDTVVSGAGATLSRAMPCRCPRFPWVPSSTQSSSSLARCRYRPFRWYRLPAHGQGGQVRDHPHASSEMRRVLVTCRAPSVRSAMPSTPTS